MVGLGNPGPEYAATRHNLGFRLVATLRERWGLDGEEELCRSRVWRRQGLHLAAPETYMNRSGWAVECLLDLLAVPRERLLVAFDDVALPLGTLRLRARGGAGGHRGLQSVLAALRTEEVPRLRLGIAPPAALPDDLSEFVLAPFAAAEQPAVDDLLARAVEAATVWRDEGIERAMNRANAGGPAG